MMSDLFSEALARRSLTLFVGADLPQNVTGIPSRAELAAGLARRHGLDETLPLAEVAQRASQANNRWEFTEFICNALDLSGQMPQVFQQSIVSLVGQHKIETIITTAYDNMLELAFQHAGVSLNRVVRSDDVNFINHSRPTLIKLYGDVQQRDTLVVTDRDHLSLLRDRTKEAIVDEVRRALRRYTVLFVGYNLADFDFRFLFEQIAESRFARIAYAVWPGYSESEVNMWRGRGIVILDTAPLGIVTRFGTLSVSLPPQAPTMTMAASTLSTIDSVASPSHTREKTTTATHTKHQYDVFLSHRGADKALVAALAIRLRAEGLKPFLDQWHLVPGEPWEEALEDALDQSATCAVFIGLGGLGPWENEAMRSALDARTRDKTLRVIPVVLPGANIEDNTVLPRFLRRLTWVDFRAGIENPEAFRRLVAGIRGEAPGSSSD
jgi:TIR domain/SIR2-like domain